MYDAQNFLDRANNGCQTAKRLLERLQRYGVSQNLLEEVNGGLSGVRLGVSLVRNQETKAVDVQHLWTYGSVPDETSAVFLAFADFLRKGKIDKLKQCAADDCDNFHFRRGKWCHDRCGARMRGQAKRRLDKQRQML